MTELIAIIAGISVLSVCFVIVCKGAAREDDHELYTTKDPEPGATPDQPHQR